MTRTVAFIPARGGSQRIPRKNIKPFAGKPMLAWPIAAAKASGLFDSIVVSTDDSEIADIAMQSGATEVLRRPDALADHHTALRPVIREGIVALEKDGAPVAHLCCLYATAAFLKPEDLIAGYSKLDAPEVEYSVSAVRYPHPVQRAFYEAEGGALNMAYPDQRTVRTQDLRPHFHDAGMFFWGRRDSFFTDISIYTPVSRLVEIDARRAIDIDEPSDWDRAEMSFELLRREGLL